MAGPQNMIMGDDFGVEIPETRMPENELLEEQKAAKYSKSHEYKKLKAHWEARIAFYQQYLPDGRPLTAASKEEREDMWLVATAIIGELRNVMNYYETAKESVEKNV